MDTGVIILIIVVVVVLIPVIWAIATYNGFVRLRNLVQEAWRQIDVELHRRYDLIPNLLDTVKGFAAHERAVFDEVTQARAAAATPGASPAEQARQEDALSGALGRLFAVAEAYPQLRSVESFVALQNELTNTEDRIAAGRRFYNANVRELNTKVESFPPNIIANRFNFHRAEYFESNDPVVRAAPRVSFQDTQGQVGVYGTPPAQVQGQPQVTDAGGPSHGGQPGGFQPGQGGGQPGYPQQPGQGGGYPPQG
ncbi:LemA family protein [Pseudactinotalea sp.]|uniref:LemA family protein n=1 Tax=Pseudactinotalea sp. TaxID=1926260 RepID=UPI003B3BAB04